MVILGDSFSEALQVPVEQTYFRLLEQHLNGAGVGRWEVFNFGVGDYGTAQQLRLLIEHVAAYRPDVIIHQIFPLNDVCNNTLALAGLCKSTNDRYRPYPVWRNGSIEWQSAEPRRK